MVVELWGGGIVHVSEAAGAAIDEVLAGGRENWPDRISFGTGKGWARPEDIRGLWTESQWTGMQREKAGDWMCGFERWHKRGETCFHRPEPDPAIDLGYIREGVDKAGTLSETGRKWLELTRRNNEALKRTGRYGTLQTLEELEVLEATGVWPEPVNWSEVSQGRRQRVMRQVASPFPVEGEPKQWREDVR